MAVALWVLIGTAGVAVLVIPALRLWRAVRGLGREVKRVAGELREAGDALQSAAARLPSGRSHTSR